MSSSIPEPLYRLRIEVLKDNIGAWEAPEHIFTFTSKSAATAAATHFRDTFGSGLSAYSITDGQSNHGDGDAGLDVEDGRTDSLRLSYDSVTADESWKEFLVRLKGVEEGWTKETKV